jgi:hypothetical protein
VLDDTKGPITRKEYELMQVRCRRLQAAAAADSFMGWFAGGLQAAAADSFMGWAATAAATASTARQHMLTQQAATTAGRRQQQQELA